ncbi:hypothetical protein RclHR1_01850002 [Rhizophagus clarus]|uniref:Galactose oxidase n=1 Tax=Rhizophagus clarus TaxID=94130 RepID=A0A2Z6QRQ5_9GLOM|nr:hypothetical protein RclHR1_01850002 [Rhizophagus clarus]
MTQLIFYLTLFLSYIAFSSAYNYSSYAPPSVVLNDRYFVEVEQEIRVGFRLYDASSVKKDSKVIKYQNLQYTTNTPDVKFPRVVGNNNKLYFFGVNGNDDVFETTIMFSFDINEKVWNELKDVNMPSHLDPNQEENFVGPDSNGNAYLFYNDYNVMVSFNTETLEWNEYTIQSFVPTGYSYYTWYTATILPDGTIAYIGGQFTSGTAGSIDAPMNQVYIYDTNTHVWAAKSTIGNPPGPRNSHSASLTSDGRIIVYGGVDANNNPANPSLAVLDINKFEWSTPNVNNPIGSIYLAPSVIINDLMFLYVGINVTTPVYNAFNKVYMLDTSTYTWSSLDPVATNTDDNIYNSGNNQLTGGNDGTANRNDLTMTLIIILIVIGSILVVAILGVTFYKLYQSRRPRQISPKIIDNPQQSAQSKV